MKNLITILMSLNLILAPVYAADGDQFRTNPDSKGAANYANQITTIGIGIVAANALTTCKAAAPLHPSIIVFSAGGLIYIMSELTAAKEQKEFLKKSAADLKMLEEKMKQGGEVQRASLQAALEKEQNNLAFVNKRKTMMMIVAGVFATAAGLSFAEMSIPIPHPPLLLGLLPAMCDGVTATMTGKVMGAGVAAAFTYAAGGPMYASMGAALLNYTLGAGMIATALNTAIPRAGIFLGAAAMVATNLKGLSDIGKQLQENIDKLKKVIAAFDAQTTPTNGTGTDLAGTTGGLTSGSTSGATSGTTSGVTRLPLISTNDSATCFSNTERGFSTSGEACNNPIRLPGLTFDPSMNLPSLQSNGQMATDLANALAAGDTARAQSLAGSLASQAGNMNQITNNVAKQVNDKLKAQGKETFDLDTLTKNGLASVSGSQDSANGSAAGMGLSSSNNSAKLGDDLKGAAEDKNVMDLDNAAHENSQKGGGTSATDLGMGSLSEGVSPTDGSSAAFGANGATKTASLSESLDDYESNESDISSDKESTLFKQVSNRYLLNYSKIFKRKEIAPANK